MIKLFTEEEYTSSKYNERLPLQCYRCGKTFYALKSKIEQASRKQDKTKCRFCSRKCILHNYYKVSNLVVSCKNCNKLIERLVQDDKQGDNFFCSRGCAVTYNNSRVPKRKKKIHLCKLCSMPTSSRSREYCKKCRKLEDEVTKRKNSFYLGLKTKTETFDKSKSWQSARSEIRRHAVYVFSSSGLPLKCKICGYSFYVEICHIKPVSQFDDSATLAEINALENLIPLCPNHHIELDRGKLVL